MTKTPTQDLLLLIVGLGLIIKGLFQFIIAAFKKNFKFK